MAALIGRATGTSKTTVNQDFVCRVDNLKAGFEGLLIADGIGSHFKAELAARFCCEYGKKYLEGLAEAAEINFDAFFKEIKLRLIEYAKSIEDIDFEKIDKTQALGTTFICILDTGSEYQIAYVGNGSVWLVDGRFNQFSSGVILPWNVINLLNPHTIEQDGKAALYRYLSIADAQYLPTIIRVSKNRFLPGEILIAATDGLYSNDQVQIGRDEAGTIWIRGEELMANLFARLSSIFIQGATDMTSGDLDFELERFINESGEKGLLHDDTTVGVMISPAALEYHKQRQISIRE